MQSFRPNCTFPQTTPTGFVFSPSIRSTLDIVWSCISIIVLSTWSILHLTVPPDITTEGRVNWLRKQKYLLSRKLAWMGVMLMFPEYLLAIGASNRSVARQNHEHLSKFAREDDVPWSRTHTVQADMGGIAIRFSKSSLDRTLVRSGPKRSGEREEELIGMRTLTTSPSVPEDEAISSKSNAIISAVNVKHTNKSSATAEFLPADANSKKFLEVFAERQGVQFGDIPWEPFPHHKRLVSEYIKPPDKPQITDHNHLAPLHGNIWVLDSNQLFLARKHKVISKLPKIERNEIEDKSKSDGLVRLLALFQVLWLIVQLCVRLVNRLSFCALEISTLAFSACAAIIYVIEWSKPKDVAVPIYIDTNVVVSLATFKDIVEAAPNIFYRHRGYNMPQSSAHRPIEDKESRLGPEYYDRLVILVTIISTALFGGIHLFAWHVVFPTHAEQIIWRISALLVAIVPAICALIVLCENLRFGTTHRYSHMVVPLFGPLYVLSRLALLVESFRSLYFLPPGALTSTWVVDVPHFS